MRVLFFAGNERSCTSFLWLALGGSMTMGLPSSSRLISLLVASLMVSFALSSHSSSSSTPKLSEDDASYTLPFPADFRVQNLDKVVKAFEKFPGRMYAGSLPMDHKSTTVLGANPNGERTGNLNFWLFVPDKIKAENTISSWFNGGPGCSSFSAGVLFENAPITLPLEPAGWCCEEEDTPLTYNKYGWTVATVMLYVEQPIGVGFSEATNDTPGPSHEDDVAADFDSFLQNFFRVFNGYETNKSKYDPKLDMTTHALTLVGESYAGTYIPSVARGIYLNNKAMLPNHDGTARFVVPLYGIAIGNGKIDALTQSAAIPDWAYWHGLIDMGTKDFFKSEWKRCMKNLNSGNYGPGVEPEPFHSFSLRGDCGIFDKMLGAAGADTLPSPFDSGPNIYEYSTWDAYAADGGNGTVGKFYNNPKVQEALNIPKHRRKSAGHHWEGCIPEVDPSWVSTDPNDLTASPNFMDNDKPWSVTPYIAELLDDAGIAVLIYSGDRDMICNTQGTDDSLAKMVWSGTLDPAPSTGIGTKTRNAWTEAKRGLWLYKGYPAGYTKQYKKLNLLSVYNAGHMVPYNQPGPALDMMIRFLKGEDFYDKPLVSYAATHLPEDLPYKPDAADIEVKVSMTVLPMKIGLSSDMPSFGMSMLMSNGSFVIAVIALIFAITSFVLGMRVGQRSGMASSRAGYAVVGAEMQTLAPTGDYGSI